MIRKNQIYLLFYLVLLLTSFDSFSQEQIKKSYFFDKKLTYNTLPDDTHGRRIISSLSSNNIKGLYTIEINISAYLQVILRKDDFGQISADILLQNHSVEGETYFRDFIIDTLLMPDIIEGSLQLYNDNGFSTTQPWMIANKLGYIQVFVSDTSDIELKDIKTVLTVDNFNYSDNQYLKFKTVTELINSYYSYIEVLKNTEAEYLKKGLNHDQSPSYLLTAWEEINRVNTYAESYLFDTLLNLSSYDPLNYLALYDRSIRLERRANTLKGWLEENIENGLLNDREAFCHSFAGLSEKYLALAREHQPHIAKGFTEVARVLAGDDVKQMLTEASQLYDVFNKLEDSSVIQSIYNHFIEFAEKEIREKNYVATLDLLYNANLMHEWFEQTNISANYASLYRDAIEGLMSSYLTVATMAYRTGSFFMAENYYQKAIDVYDLHDDKLNGERLASDAFLKFIRQQTDLSFKMIEDKQFFKAIELLNKSSMIVKEQEIDTNNLSLDSAYRLGYSGLYVDKLDSVQTLLEQHNPEEALEALDRTNEFKEEKSSYLNNINQARFSFLADALFGIYFEKGIYQLNSAKPEQALFTFLKARSINKNYLHKNTPELDSLIYNATVPVILDYVKKGGFEVWANRIGEANLLLAKAIELQDKYEQQDNEEIISAISNLKLKIEHRYCINLSNNCFALQKQATNRLANRKYNEARTLLQEALSIIEENDGCRLPTKSIDALYMKNRPVFDYYDLVEATNTAFAEKNYLLAIEQFDKLEKFHQSRRIHRYGILKPDVYEFVKNHHNVTLTRAAIEYHIEKNRFEVAFRYLGLLKAEEVPAKGCADLQESVGKGLASTGTFNLTGNSQIKKVIKGRDRWYRYFRRSYLRTKRNNK